MTSQFKTFGAFISETRKTLSLSQKELASKILREEDDQPISPQYLNDIEKDRRTPSSEHMMEQFAKALSVDKDYLYYLVGSLPTDIRNQNMDKNQVSEIFQAFRGGPPPKKRS